MKNNGKPSEKLFEEAWARLGKRAWAFSFTDTAEARGMNKGKNVFVKAQPADYLVVYQGAIFFAEVKSTIDAERFKFSLLRTSQSYAAAATLAAGGPYYIFIHSLAQSRWYRVPYDVVAAAKAEKKGSLLWSELESFSWSFPNA